MTHSYRISPANPLIVEWRLDQDGARWGFYRICDSPNDARRSWGVLQRDHEAESERRAPTLFDLELEAEVA